MSMLTQLTIKNFGLLDSISFDPGRGLNVFTGETGAGKSILIDALRFALGSRIIRAQIRDLEKPCLVEAVFEITGKAAPALREHLDDDGLLIIRRTHTPDGKTRNKVNDLSVTVSRLRELGDHLVDLHGPHDHQMLFAEDSHLSILDRLSSIEQDKKEYEDIYRKYRSLSNRLEETEKLALSRERELDVLSHRMKELEQVPLDTDEYEKILRESARLNNTENLHEHVTGLLELLDADDTGINSSITKAFSLTRPLKNTDESAAEIEQILLSMQENGNNLSSALNGYLESLSFQPGTAEDINGRMDIYTDLLRKYGPSLEEVKKFYLECRQRRDLLLDLDHNTSELKKELASTEKKTRAFAERLSAKRKKSAVSLKTTIENELRELGISRVAFECRIERTELSAAGSDRAVFYISPNAGEGLKPLSEIISSGEAARVMLALKKALTKVDPIPVLIFDEIDAQIGGRLGTVTGTKLKELSGDRQVLLITHLPQIASFGDRHFKVLKTVARGRTRTEVKLIEGEQRISELSKMLSGEKQTAISVEHARDMLYKAVNDDS